MFDSRFFLLYGDEKWVDVLYAKKGKPGRVSQAKHKDDDDDDDASSKLWPWFDHVRECAELSMKLEWKNLN